MLAISTHNLAAVLPYHVIAGIRLLVTIGFLCGYLKQKNVSMLRVPYRVAYGQRQLGANRTCICAKLRYQSQFDLFCYVIRTSKRSLFVLVSHTTRLSLDISVAEAALGFHCTRSPTYLAIHLR